MLIDGRIGVTGEDGIWVGPTKGEAGRAKDGAKGEGGPRPTVGRGDMLTEGEPWAEMEGVPGVEGAQGSPWSSWT